MKERRGTIITIGFPAIMIVGLLGLTRGCNAHFNSKTIVEEGRATVSYLNGMGGLSGHNEYTLYPDGSADLKTYPSVGSHRIRSSFLYQELDGDGQVDRIRSQGSELKMHTLEDILIREFDYENHQAEFDDADKLITEGHTKLEQALSDH